MPNAITATGLTTATREEIIAFYTAAFQAIYGADINLDSDSPDGQMINDFAQAVLDNEDLLMQINSQFDPDQAIGVILDQRVAINGIQRKAGTATVTPITIVNSQSVNLYGADQTVQPVYTVSDNAGNLWQLQATQLGLAAGTHSLQFQSAVVGAVLTTPNTINIPVTIVLGVVSINNPTTYTSLGINEESDAQLRIRRQQSVSLASQGYLQGLLAALENINGVSAAYVYENVTGTTDVDGVPGHSIWVIVGGTAAAVDIATAIYQKRNAGCGMFGSQSYVITQVDGSPFIILWDVVTPEDLFIKFTATSLDGINPPNIAAIRSGLVTSFTPGVFAEVNINELATLVQQIDPNTLVTNAGFSTSVGGSYSNTLSPTSKNFQFVITSPNIIITPMILSPSLVTLMHGTSQQFTGLGGFGTLTYSFVTNVSGGAINSSTGFYTAGATPGTDVVMVADSLSNTATAAIVVT